MSPRILVALVLAVLPLTACAQDDEVTVGGPLPGASGGRALTLDGAGRELDDAQADQALLDEQALPDAPGTAWSGEPEVVLPKAGAADDDSIRESSCRTWFHGWDDAAAKARTGRMRTFKSTSGSATSELTYGVRTFDDPGVASERQRLMSQVPQDCRTFTVDRPNGAGGTYPTSWTVSPSEFERPGDASGAAEMTAEYTNPVTREHVKEYQQIVIVQVGHNEIYVQSFGRQPIPSTALTTMLDNGLGRLERAAS